MGTPAVWRRALTLGAALLAAKGAVVVLRVIDGGGRDLATPLAPLALTFQDAWLLLAVVAVDLGACALVRGRPRAARAHRVTAWAIVIATVGYAAFNVAVARVFSTPLTISMLGAAGGALADSILGYVTTGNLLSIAAVALCAIAAYRFAPPAPGARGAAAAAAALLALAALGPLAAKRVETLGLHRNAALALLSTWAARRAAPPPGGAVAALPPEGPALDLTHLAGSARGRNVIWVILESTGARYLGAYGATPDPTPRLTALAEKAVVFDSAYCVQPESIKGLFTMLCGTPSAPNTEASDYTADRTRCASIAAELKRAGYRTGLFHSGRFRYLGMQGVVDGRGFDELHDAQSIGGKFSSSFGTDDRSTVHRLLAFVDAGPKDQRFFAVYSPIAGHHPYKSPGDGPRPFPQDSEFDAYLNDLYMGDHAFGELVDGIAARGLSERTLWLIVGDHGQAFHQHEGNFAHTLFLYEENLHVPFIIAAPGITPRRVRAPQITSLIDLSPTTLSLLGLPVPEGVQGRSALIGEPGVARSFTDHGPLKLALRQDRYKVIVETERDRTKLFDLRADPRETEDVASENPERAARYREHLLAWAASERRRILAR